MRKLEAAPATMDWQARAAHAEARSGVYCLLAQLFGNEPTPALLASLREGPVADALSELGATFPVGPDPVEDEETIGALAEEYTRLFLGPGPHVSPFESVHAAPPGQARLWGEPAVVIKRLVDFLGLEFAPDYGGIPDHLSVELELMCKLADREAQAWRAEDSEGALWCLRHERLLLHEHLAQWVPAFCREVGAQAAHRFYRQAGELLRHFVALDADMVTDSLSPNDGSTLS